MSKTFLILCLGHLSIVSLLMAGANANSMTKKENTLLSKSTDTGAAMCFSLESNFVQNDLKLFWVHFMWPSYVLLHIPGFFFKFIFYCCSITVVPIFPSLVSPTLPTPISHIQSSPPLFFVHGSFIHILWWPFPFPSPLPSGYSPLPSPLVTVSLFFISMSLVLFCSLVCFID